MSGEELARALYGVHGSEVTVRAEIARLRRRLGPLVASQPYRLVADVHADFLEVEWMASPRRAGGGERRSMSVPCCPTRTWQRSPRLERGSSAPAHAGRGATMGEPALQPPCNPGSAPERPSRPRDMLAPGCPRQKEGMHPMAIDFTLTNEQRELQSNTREFAENVLGPVVREADAEPDPLRGFQRTKEAYIAAYRAGIAFCMLPREYGGGGVSNVELIIAAEEICAIDPGFACTVLVNGLGLLPVWYWGNEEQKDRYLRAATSDPTGEYIVGYAVSEPAGSPGGTANFDTPLPHPVGIGVTAVRDGDEYVLNGRKYWPCNVGGWDGQGANTSIVVVRTDPDAGGTEGLSAIMVDRGTAGRLPTSSSTRWRTG